MAFPLAACHIGFNTCVPLADISEEDISVYDVSMSQSIIKLPVIVRAADVQLIMMPLEP